jgi:hypothetical protein
VKTATPMAGTVPTMVALLDRKRVLGREWFAPLSHQTDASTVPWKLYHTAGAFPVNTC